MEQEFLSLVTGQRSVDGSVADSEGGEETEGEESTRVSPRGLVHVFLHISYQLTDEEIFFYCQTNFSEHTYVVHT